MERKHMETPSSGLNQAHNLSESLLAAISPSLSRDQLAKLIGEAMLKTAMIDNTEKNGAPMSVTTSTPTQNNVLNEVTPIKDQVVAPVGVNLEQEQLIINQTKTHITAPFTIPTDQVLVKLDSIQSIALKLGNKSTELESWYCNLMGLLDSFLNQLQLDKQMMNESFIKSLETISVISSITSRFSSSSLSSLSSLSTSKHHHSENDIHISQILNESSDTSVTLKLQQLIIDYKSQSFTKLEDYSSDKSSMFALSETIEKTIIKLIPVLATKLKDFTNKLYSYYTKLSMLSDDCDIEMNDFKINENFANLIPPMDLVKRNYNNTSDMSVSDIKDTLQSKYKNLNPELLSQTDREISRLNEVVLLRCQKLKSLQFQILKLNHSLYERGEMGYIDVISSNFKDNETILNNVGINMKIIEKYQSQLTKLEELQVDRERQQRFYKSKVISIWTMLHPESTVDEIENKLKPMSTLFESSLSSLSSLLKSLEIEKRKNIGRFIEGTRRKIVNCWDKLMYDDELRSQFVDFDFDDESLLTEECLNVHNDYLNSLMEKVKELEPLLVKVEEMQKLLDMRTELDQAQKNPSRLLKQNSFKVLRREELVRKKINNELPLAVSNLKVAVQDWEEKTGRIFKVEGVEYLNKLDEIENTLPKRRSFIKPFSATSSLTRPSARNLTGNSGQRSTASITTAKRTFSQTGMKTPTPRSVSNKSNHSIIKHISLSDFTDPFQSRRNTPSNKRPKLETKNSSVLNEPLAIRNSSTISSPSIKNERRKPLLSITSAQRKPNNEINTMKLGSPLNFGSPPKIHSPTRNSRIPSLKKPNEKLSFIPILKSRGTSKSPQKLSSPIGLGIYSPKVGDSSTKKEAEIILSDLEIEHDDEELIDKENVKPPTAPEVKKLNNNDIFNLSAIDAETF